MLQDWLRVKSVDGAYWTISSFLSFYFIVFLIHKFNLKKMIYQFCFVWILMICVVKAGSLSGYHVSKILRITFLLDHGSFFIIGIMIYLVKFDRYNFYNIFLIISCLLTICFAGGMLDFIAAIIFSLVLLLIILDRLPILNRKPLLFLGSISYSLYLVHQNIGYIIIRQLYKFDFNYFMIILIPIVISLFLATIITFYFEKPILTYFRNRFEFGFSSQS